jgi:hypothetical protein
MDRCVGTLTSRRFDSDVTDFTNLLCTQLRSILRGNIHFHQPSQQLLPACRIWRLWRRKRTSTLCRPNHFVCPRTFFKLIKQQNLISYSSFRMRTSRNKPGMTSLCTYEVSSFAKTLITNKCTKSSRLQKQHSTQSTAHSHSTTRSNLSVTITKKFSLKMTQQGRNR